ncbi:hypothetical protein HKX48_008431 [Thoreauomyces humboldtii]|nr:hypothetical protein HKX48_008431 [Thoreauomyces humboldtii]
MAPPPPPTPPPSRTFSQVAGTLASSSTDSHAEDKDFFLSCTWEEPSPSSSNSTAFTVQLTDGKAVWDRCVTLSDLRVMKPEDVDERTHVRSTRAALEGGTRGRTREGQATACTVKAEEFRAEFALGRLDLSAKSTQEARWTCGEWIRELVATRTENRERMEGLEEKVADLQVQRKDILEEHEAWVSTKREGVERTIYKKFKEVLNAKKKKIRQLIDANAALAAETLKAQQALERMRLAKEALTAAPDPAPEVDAMDVDELLSATRLPNASTKPTPLSDDDDDSSDGGPPDLLGNMGFGHVRGSAHRRPLSRVPSTTGSGNMEGKSREATPAAQGRKGRLSRAPSSASVGRSAESLLKDL